MTQKDRDRVAALIEFTKAGGITKGVARAEHEATSISNPAKCIARAELLEGAGFTSLAKPFNDRLRWLRAGRPPQTEPSLPRSLTRLLGRV